MNDVAIGSRVKALRGLRGLSMGALAEMAGVSVSYISRLEDGQRENTSAKSMMAVATALGVPTDLLIESSPSSSGGVLVVEAFNEKDIDTLLGSMVKFLAENKVGSVDVDNTSIKVARDGSVVGLLTYSIDEDGGKK